MPLFLGVYEKKSDLYFYTVFIHSTSIHTLKLITMMRYLANIFVSIDQFGNVVAGGYPDNTISSRVGFYTQNEDNSSLQWRVFKNIINVTFWPIDGPDHCKEAYFNDAGESFDDDTSNFAILVLTIIIIPSCVLIGILLYILYLGGVVSPKMINRKQNIIKRLTSAKDKLKGAHTELNTHVVRVDKDIDEALDKTEIVLSEIAEKIDGMIDFKARVVKYKQTKLSTKV